MAAASAAAAEHDPDGAVDVRRRRGAQARAEPIVAGLLELDAEGSRHRRHGVAGVRALGHPPVARPDRQRAPGRTAPERRRQREQQRRHARGHEIGEVVEARGGFAQPLELAAVADHGVERVDGAVGDRARARQPMA